MRITGGFWVSLVNRQSGRVLYQVSTDTVTDAEFMELWGLTGRAALAALKDEKRGQVEFEIRAQKVEP